ncbi:hypothetical protein CIHG_04735 [Coccidioides immitis H538.4]|uniref:Uncharacterized protein n=1 Tax=Coccidioides immitis H538.4 TaxID=396776 RepID=A0A0J8RQD0_COCIT|nr:hypothetical protein CIHG_04735 [Coccidioides immitis H538.4]
MRSGSLMWAFAAGQGGAPNGISTVADGPMGKGFEAVHDKDRLRVVSLLGRIQNSRSTPDTLRAMIGRRPVVARARVLSEPQSRASFQDLLDDHIKRPLCSKLGSVWP